MRFAWKSRTFATTYGYTTAAMSGVTKMNQMPAKPRGGWAGSIVGRTSVTAGMIAIGASASRASR
jgi:hypothetical protein